MPYHGKISHIFGAKCYSTDFALDLSAAQFGCICIQE